MNFLLVLYSLPFLFRKDPTVLVSQCQNVTSDSRYILVPVESVHHRYLTSTCVFIHLFLPSETQFSGSELWTLLDLRLGHKQTFGFRSVGRRLRVKEVDILLP